MKKRLLIIAIAVSLSKAAIVHARQHADTLAARPKVALVLSGGGARGAAHVGVIRLIEEMQIPVDCVVGTSMGAIVGALYAIGYTASDMDSLFMTQDWKLLLSNDIPRREQPYAQRMARKQYQINIPYEKSVFTENSVHYRDAGIKVRRTSLQTFPKILARPGLIDGNNLLDKFNQLTYAYHDSLSYDRLPREYACVATDLVTGKEVVLREGRLAESVRASMSIPGVFYPVYKDAQVLVDGGVVNNYPVNVARAMGADIIIGVEVNSASINANDLQSFSSIFERLIGTLGTELHERNVSDTDILICPPVKQFPVMGFDTVNLRQLIDIGYKTAQLSKLQLDSLCQYLDTSDTSYTVKEVGLPNPKHTQSSHTNKNESVPNVSSLTNQVALGIRLDSEEGAAALLNIGLDHPKLTGMRFDLTTRLSINPWVEARASYGWTDRVRVGVAIKYWGADVNRFYDKNSYTLRYNLYGTDIFASTPPSSDYNLRVGVRYDHFAVHNLIRNTHSSYEYTDTKNDESYTTIYTLLQGDEYNTPYFPTRGYAYEVAASYNIKNRSLEGSNFGALQGSISTVASWSSTTALLPALYIRHLIGESIPLIYSNAMGGYLPHRYLRQQAPFVGFVGSEFMERHLTILRFEMRQRLWPDIYASGIINYAYSSDRLTHPTEKQDIWGLGIQLAYDTTLGPLALCAHWSDLYHQFGLYFSLGFEF